MTISANGNYTGITWDVTHATIVSGQGTPTLTVRTQHDPNERGSQLVEIYLTARAGSTDA